MDYISYLSLVMQVVVQSTHKLTVMLNGFLRSKLRSEIPSSERKYIPLSIYTDDTVHKLAVLVITYITSMKWYISPLWDIGICIGLLVVSL